MIMDMATFVFVFTIHYIGSMRWYKQEEKQRKKKHIIGNQKGAFFKHFPTFSLFVAVYF